MAGVPPQDHEAIYATWLALGGATAAVVHGIGDFFPGRFDFIVPARKGTRLPGVRLRVRRLTRKEVIPVGGLPALTAERAIADLIEIGADLSLVAGAVRDAVRAEKLVAPDRLVSYLDPVAARRKSDHFGVPAEWTVPTPQPRERRPGGRVPLGADRGGPRGVLRRSGARQELQPGRLGPECSGLDSRHERPVTPETRSAR
jgi:hypothetical protein